MLGAMNPETAALQRTSRYLRLGIAGCVVIIVVAVVVASAQLGQVLPSISSYYYSPARGILVGALIAVSIGVIALSGTGFERAALDAAAVFAPLIGIIPTRILPGTIPGFESPCGSSADECIPDDLLPTIQNGVIAYLIVAGILLVIAPFIAKSQNTLRESVPSLIIALVVMVLVGATGLAAPRFLLDWGHLIAAGAFFVVIAVVAFRNVWPFPGEAPRGRGVSIAFGLIGVAMLVDVIALMIIGVIGGQTGPLVFALELVALTLFVTFWSLQSGRTHPA